VSFARRRAIDLFWQLESDWAVLVADDRFWPILLKKSVCPNCLIIDW